MQFFSSEIWQSWQNKRNHALDGQLFNRAVSKCVSNEVVESTNWAASLSQKRKNWPSQKSDSKSDMVGLFSSYFFRPFIASPYYPRDFSGIFAILSSLIYLLTHGSRCSYQTAPVLQLEQFIKNPFPSGLHLLLIMHTVKWKPYFFFYYLRCRPGQQSLQWHQILKMMDKDV